MEWEWNRSRDGMGMEWEGGLTGLDPSHLTPSQRAGVTGHSPAVAVGGDSTIARSGLGRARASSLARSSATPSEIAL